MVLEYFLYLFCTAADSGTGGACLENASSTFSFSLKVFIASPQIHMGGEWHGNLDSGINFLSPRGERGETAASSLPPIPGKHGNGFSGVHPSLSQARLTTAQCVEDLPG